MSGPAMWVTQMYYAQYEAAAVERAKMQLDGRTHAAWLHGEENWIARRDAARVWDGKQHTTSAQRVQRAFTMAEEMETAAKTRLHGWRALWCRIWHTKHWRPGLASSAYCRKCGGAAWSPA